MNKIKFWYQNARPISLPQSILPSITAIILAVGSTSFSWWLSLIAVFGVVCAHLGMNLADDYFDYKTSGGNIRSNIHTDSIRARTDKCAYLTSGAATVKQLFAAMNIFLLLAVAAGLIVFYFRGWPIIIITLTGLLLGISYSGFPFHLGYHGLGEIVIGIMFGPLLMIGVYYSACGLFNGEIVWFSIAVGLLVMNIVYTHSVMETDADEKMCKMTLARLLGDKRKLVFSVLFTFLPFIIITTGVAFHLWHPAYLFTLVLLPMAVYLNYSLIRFARRLPTDDTPRFWMGPMGNFEQYKAAGIDWFLIRWLIARNITTFFCLIIIICALLFG